MLESELETTMQIARQAGSIAMKHFRKAPEYWHKEDGQGRVSVADLEVDAYLHEALDAAFPKDAILSEERDDDPARLDAQRIWIIDPIDGTEAYLNGQEFFSVSLGLVQNGEVILGVVYAPAIELMYCAYLGGGARLNGKSIRISEQQDITQAKILASGARYNREMIKAMPVLDLHFRPSVALRLGLMASGDFDASFAMRPSWEWDLAAGMLILEEAGGILVDGDGLRPKFNAPHPQIKGMIAGAPILVHELLKRIKD